MAQQSPTDGDVKLGGGIKKWMMPSQPSAKLMGKRELVALLNSSSWCLVMVERLFLAVPWGCLRFVIVVFPDHTHLLFSKHGRLVNAHGHHITLPSASPDMWSTMHATRQTRWSMMALTISPPPRQPDEEREC